MLAINLNLKGHYPTQFLNYNFLSLCNFKGKLLGAKENGLFELTGEQDHETEIQAKVETPLSAWGVNQVKRPRKCRLSYASDDELELSVIDADLDVVETKDVPTSSGSLPQNSTFNFSRTTAKNFWTFRISNKDGSDFKINALEVLFTVRPHGLSQST